MPIGFCTSLAFLVCSLALFGIRFIIYDSEEQAIPMRCCEFYSPFRETFSVNACFLFPPVHAWYVYTRCFFSLHVCEMIFHISHDRIDCFGFWMLAVVVVATFFQMVLNCSSVYGAVFFYSPSTSSTSTLFVQKCTVLRRTTPPPPHPVQSAAVYFWSRVLHIRVCLRIVLHYARITPNLAAIWLQLFQRDVFLLCSNFVVF